MPKARADRQLPYVLALRKMRGGLQVLPVYRSSSHLVLERNESRWPDLHKGVVKGADNRMGIPAGCVLDKQHVIIGPRSPFWDHLHRDEARAFWRIVMRDGEFRLPVVAVVNGLAFAQRRRVHILSQYHGDLQGLQSSITVVQARLDDPMVRLSGKQQQTLLAAVANYELRINDIRAILSDRAAREVGLKLAFETAQTRLAQIGSNLKRIGGLARANRRPRLVRVRETTDRYVDELVGINSREVRSLVSPVRVWLRQLVRVEGSYIGPNLAERFDRVGDRLLEAALQLHLQAQDIDPNELTAARQLELVGA